MKKLSRREFIRLSGTVALGAMAAACAPAGPAAPAAEQPKAEAQPAAAEEAQKMVFWPEWGGKDADALKVQVDKFSEETGIQVDFLPVRDHARMIASMGAGNPPDLLMTWDANAVGSWGFAGALRDLGPYIEASQFDLDALHPLGVQSGNLMGLKQIGLPLSNYLTSVLYWNKDAFEAAGLDPETPPETWEQLRAFHDKITVVENGEIRRWGYMIMQGQDGHPLTMAYAWGGKMYSDDMREVTPDNEGKIESLRWMRKFYEDYGVDEVRRWQGSITTSADSPTNPLYTGDAAMQLTGEWMPSFIERLEGITVNYGAAYMPYPEAKPEVKGTMTANSNPMIIPSAAKNPDAAWQFIMFISQPENSAEMCHIVGNASPVKKGVELQAAKTENPVYKWLLEDVWTHANVKPMTINSPVGALYMDVLSRETTLVLEEGKDPVEAMRQVKEEVQPELDAALKELGL
ncbi:MAG: ABC transporter substrate-binding protein [Anaerolineae bacterium]